MDLETAQTTTTAKFPILKQGKYDMWRLRIEQYFQVQDYSLWDVIENGNSFKPASQTTTNADGTSTTLIPGLVTTDENVQKKKDVKARRMLLMVLPNEHLMTFNQYKDAKTLFAAIQTRFGGNEATKKTQKTLLKQIKPNGSQLVYEDLEQIHEEIDLKWQLTLLSMRTRRFFQKTGRKITINRSDTAGYDKSNVECFNCHKMGYFVSECRGPRNQDSRNRNQESSKGLYIADEEVLTNMALIAFSDSEDNPSSSSNYLAIVTEHKQY
ncbi:ribonuclease H-like domain-containing protein [Tanacetum coccineum]